MKAKALQKEKERAELKAKRDAENLRKEKEKADLKAKKEAENSRKEQEKRYSLYSFCICDRLWENRPLRAQYDSRSVCSLPNLKKIILTSDFFLSNWYLQILAYTHTKFES